ncbi:MAG: inorganic phosphate transporter [Clostridia bacterium]|nr:inorganic phosphate transporter [Clostridia bacterium]MBO5432497.1 inorganic phosphate transporter [Clostridia bacterium]MBP3559322.1 inorganic phosphate transporter [Clostridia bacterium]
MLFHSLLSLSPLSVTTVLLTLAVVFVNGLTDAPNAISTVVVTRCMKLRYALIMSAFFNFCGVTLMSKINDSVTVTISNIVDFGGDTRKASIALAAALFSIVLWAVLAWYFGIPTSESHALIAGLTGSAVAINGGFNAINSAEWIKTVKGLFVSCLFGFVAGFLICKIIVTIFRNIKRSNGEKIFKYGQILAAASMSFMHGAQDGQKFIAVLMMSVNFSGVRIDEKPHEFIILLCSVIMALGTLTGGKKIIKAVGMDMVKLQKYQGFSADTASSISLLLSTLFGFPVSTTHAKTTAMMGAGASKSLKTLDVNTIKEIALTWLLTFPGCGLLGFVVTKIFLKIF